MPVNTPHPDFLHWKPDWKKIRDFLAGARAVKAAGEEYLPRLSGQKDGEFANYRLRAEVYGALDRTVDGLEGAVFRKDPDMDGVKPEDPIAADATLTGVSLIGLARDLTREVLTTGRHGVLVEMPASAPAGESVRPYLVQFAAEKILNWATEFRNGKEVLTMVVLEEADPVTKADDPFVTLARKKYRVLRMVDNAYRVEIWTAKPNSAAAGGQALPESSNTIRPANPIPDEYVMTETIIPVKAGSPLNFIPFFFFSPSGGHVSPQKPPLLDVADLNHQHYLVSADYGHGLHYVGLPVLYAFGVDKNTEITLGPSAALVSENENASAGIIEFQGQGLGAYRERLQDLEKKMAALGARLLEEQKKEAEAAETVKLRQAGDESVLAAIAAAVGKQLAAAVSAALWWAAACAGTDFPQVKIELNRDYVGRNIDPALLTALLQARQAGEITRETFIWNLHRGEMLKPGTSVEDEIERAKDDAPPMPEPAGGSQNE
jgi:hypothetical protein